MSAKGSDVRRGPRKEGPRICSMTCAFPSPAGFPIAVLVGQQRATAETPGWVRYSRESETTRKITDTTALQTVKAVLEDAGIQSLPTNCFASPERQQRSSCQKAAWR